jgi:hypothetical protein
VESVTFPLESVMRSEYWPVGSSVSRVSAAPAWDKLVTTKFDVLSSTNLACETVVAEVIVAVNSVDDVLFTRRGVMAIMLTLDQTVWAAVIRFAPVTRRML